MTDLTEQLRGMAQEMEDGFTLSGAKYQIKTLRAAADEIERLQAETARMAIDLTSKVDQIDRMHRTITEVDHLAETQRLTIAHMQEIIDARERQIDRAITEFRGGI